jgi:hypothetical protein
MDKETAIKAYDALKQKFNNGVAVNNGRMLSINGMEVVYRIWNGKEINSHDVIIFMTDKYSKNKECCYYDEFIEFYKIS